MYKSLVVVIILILSISLIPQNCDENQGSEETIILVNKVKSSGKHFIIWDQSLNNQNQAPEGFYLAKMDAGSYNSEESFSISLGVQPVLSPCDSLKQKYSSEGLSLPTQYAFSINAPEYAIGDTVCIIYDLPQDDSV